MPLPPGASFDTMTGEFRFVPAPEQVGTLEFTFFAETAALTDQQTVTVIVEDSIAAANTSIVGVVWGTDNEPIPGVTVSVGSVSVVTNVLGGFLLNEVEDDTITIVFDGSTVPPDIPDDPPPFPTVPEQIELVLGHPLYVDVRNVVDRPVFLPVIDWANADPIDGGGGTVDNPDIGVAMIVPPNPTNPNGTMFEGLMAISEVPPDQAPIALPEDLAPAQLISIQPGGVQFAQPAMITFPNLDGLPVDSETDIWSIDPSSGTFEIVGVGRVQDDGQGGTHIVTISGGIRTASWHAMLPPGGDCEMEPPPPPPGGGCRVGSTVNYQTGVLDVDHELVGHRTLDQERGLRLVWRSDRVNPRPIVAERATILFRAAVPNTLSASLQLGGVMMGEPVFYDTSSLSESMDESLRVALQCDASDFPTRAYDTVVRLASNYNRSSVSTTVTGTAVVDNLNDSPFGAGWGLAGLQRLRIMPNDDALITNGNGAAQAFRAVRGLVVETYATVPTPVGMSFDASGNLYVGFGRVGTHGPFRIHRVSPGGAPVAPYGDPILDPDYVLVDAAGLISGTVGAVLVGGACGGGRGCISAILPDQDQTTITVFGPTSVFQNPADMKFDSTGRLVFGDDNGRQVLE